MKRIKLIPMLFVALGFSCAYADDVQHVVWDKTPINIVLPVGEERMITFPGTVKFGYDVSELSSDSLSVVNNNDTVYLTAHATFQSQPVQVLLTQNGKIILVNLAATDNAVDTPIEVEVAEAPTADSASNTGESTKAPVDVSYVTLTRFAAQQLYAPQRLLTYPDYIHRIAMHTDRQVPLMLDDAAMANPMISWQAENFYITAVELHNHLDTSQKIDPRSFCGEFLAATLFPRTLLTPAFTNTDNTTAFLISSKPFGEAIAECSGAGA